MRRTPKGLETPKYSVVGTIDGPSFLGTPETIELRRYEEFVVARTGVAGGEAQAFGSRASSGGFNTLAGYLFGRNEEKTAMAMTMPVEMSSSNSSDKGSMSFVLPKRNADAPPMPLSGDDVSIETVPARLVAAKAFSGLVTKLEVERQAANLRDAIAADGSFAPAAEGEFSVLQYNSPLAVPWRRRNEVVIVVTETATAESDAVKSWYDAGVRL